MRSLTDKQYRLLDDAIGMAGHDRHHDGGDDIWIAMTTLERDGIARMAGSRIVDGDRTILWAVDINRARVAVNIHRAMMARESQ